MGNQLSSDGSVVSGGFTEEPTVERFAENDDKLLNQIAEERSEKAFEILYKRHQKRLYNLAYFMTRNEQMARDAIQDALFDLWASAKNYQSGNARGWITMILVRNIYDQRTRRQGETNRIAKRVEKGFGEQAVVTPPQQLEQHEQLNGLRIGLELLEAKDRSLVALYFGGQLSQEEIGRITGIPQTTVSSHIKRITVKLQEHCRKAGLMGATMTLDPDQIRDAIITGRSVPSGVLEDVQVRIADGNEVGLETGHSFSWPLWVSAAFLLVAIGCGGLWLTQKQDEPINRDVEARSKAPLDDAPQLTSAWNIAPDSKPFRYEWDFRNRQLKGIKIGRGQVRWLKDRNNETLGLEALGGGATLLFPVQVTHRDFIVEIQLKTIAPEWVIGLQTGASPKKSKSYRWNISLPISRSEFRRLTFYIKDQMCYCFSNDKMSSVVEYLDGRGTGLAFNIRTIEVHEIVVRSYQADEHITKAMKMAADQIKKNGKAYKVFSPPIPQWYQVAEE